MILIRLKGGLGNQMFQYATALALAKRHKTELKMDLTLLLDRETEVEHMVYRDYELGAFLLDQNFATEAEIIRFNPRSNTFLEKIRNRLSGIFRSKKLYIETDPGYDPGLLRLPDDYCLVGTFQTENYFKHIRPDVLKSFRFRNSFDTKVLDFAERLRSRRSLCLHVRRGDYVQNAKYSKLLGALPVRYYERGVEYLSKENPPEEIFVFSDDLRWCAENLKFGIKCTFVSEDHVPDNHHVHLYLMSQCSDFVISNSTYSWWGAWLSEAADKRVVGPSDWFADPAKNSTDILASGWIKLKAREENPV